MNNNNSEFVNNTEYLRGFNELYQTIHDDAYNKLLSRGKLLPEEYKEYYDKGEQIITSNKDNSIYCYGVTDGIKKAIDIALSDYEREVYSNPNITRH